MRRTSVVLAALTFLTTACGARWTDTQQARVTAREKGTSSGQAAAAAETSDAATTNDTTATGAPVGGGGATASGGAAATGGAASAKTATGAPRPCAAASNATGVTADKINIGSISTLSGPSPGIGASSAAAVRAYVAYRNATGGVCGRKVVLKEADDGFDAGRYRTVLTEMSGQVLGLAGGFAGGDIGAHDLIKEKAIPIVDIPSSDTLNDLPTLFDMNPEYKSLDAVIGKYKYLYDHGARKVSSVYLAVDQSRGEAQIQQRLMKAAGLQVVQVQELPLSTLSYDSSARSVANSGADYLFFIGTADSNVSMAKSMADTGYKLKFAEYYVFSYGTNFAQQTGAAGEGATSWLRTLPTEDASKNAEMKAYVEWMERVAPGEPKDAFAADAWTGAKAFLDTLSNIPGPISRELLVAGLRGTKSFDAGGMMAAILLGEKRTNGCFVGVQVQSGVWKRMTPAEGFIC